MGEDDEFLHMDIGIYLYHMFGHLHVPGQAICTTFNVFVSQKVQRYPLPAHHSASLRLCEALFGFDKLVTY